MIAFLRLGSGMERASVEASSGELMVEWPGDLGHVST